MLIRNDDYYSYPLHMTGMATTLPADDGDDIVSRLHEVVKEVTGLEVPRPEKARIGFLPWEGA